jgi:hypothetical protein
VDVPVPIDIVPVEPQLDVPELNANMPLTPFLPAFVVRIVMDPLEDAIPNPVDMPMCPPVVPLAAEPCVLSPEVTTSSPPTPLLPLPTVKLIAPPLPPVDAPEPIETEPEPPELVVPELNTSVPLMPVSPAFIERILIAPLVVGRP